MKTYLDVIQEQGTFLQATCNGNKTCGQCKIIMEKVVPIYDQEKRFLSDKDISNNIRLACFHEYDSNVTYQLLKTKFDILDSLKEEKSNNKEHHNHKTLIIDIGTTTIVMKWVALNSGKVLKTKSFRNPQITYGSDVVSRIRYSINKPFVLHDILIDKITCHLEGETDFSTMVVCGNTVMLNLFLNQDITTLGVVPFIIPIKDMQIITSPSIFKNVNREFTVITFPHIDSYVGGDIVAGIYATNIDMEKNNCMLIDLGTNGEIVVGNNKTIYTTSTAAGPAFEGVGINCGCPSIQGAVTKVSYQNGKVYYTTIGNLPPIGICGSGLVSIIAMAKNNGIIDELGRFTSNQKELFISKDVYINQCDIQKFILAKAAIQAGIMVLLEKVESVEKIYIAGGLGTNIDIQDLIDLKIIPSKYVDCVESVGNSALQGIYSYSLKQDKGRIENIVKLSKSINLATLDNFDDYLIEGLYIDD